MKKLLLATTLCAVFGAAQAVPTLVYDLKAGASYANSGVETFFSGSALNAAIFGSHFDSSIGYMGYTGGSIKLSESPASLTFTYLGKEAGHTNTFKYANGGGAKTFNNTTSAAFTSLFSVDVDDAFRLNLTFTDTNTSFVAKSGNAKNANTLNNPCNGQAVSVCNPNNQSIGFLDLRDLTEEYASFAGDFDYLLLFNDDWSDADYNDMVVGVKVAAPIPEPETYALMLAGLGVVGFMARRRRQV
jgi:hypothetical protein